MRYQVIATDYDGTLATEGSVDAPTLAALGRYREAGGRLLLVTGRELPDLQQVFPEIPLFEGVVAENGAIFYHPQTDQVQTLADPFPPEFLSALRQQQVDPLNQGQVMISTLHPHAEIVQQTIRSMTVQARVIWNKGAVMVLPAGVNKATGLRFALDHLQISPDRVAGIGDAENDRDLLLNCGLAVAVENALTDLKAIAHQVTTQPRGAGVEELVDWILTEGG